MCCSDWWGGKYPVENCWMFKLPVIISYTYENLPRKWQILSRDKKYTLWIALSSRSGHLPHASGPLHTREPSSIQNKSHHSSIAINSVNGRRLLGSCRGRRSCVRRRCCGRRWRWWDRRYRRGRWDAVDWSFGNELQNEWHCCYSFSVKTMEKVSLPEHTCKTKAQKMEHESEGMSTMV